MPRPTGLDSSGTSSSERPETEWERADLGLLTQTAADSSTDNVFFFWEWSGSKIFQLFSQFWLQRFPAVLQLIDYFYLLWYDTNKRFGTGTRLRTAWRILRALQYLLRILPKLSRGNGTRLEEKTSGITQTETRDPQNVTFVYICCALLTYDMYLIPIYQIYFNKNA